MNEPRLALRQIFEERLRREGLRLSNVERQERRT